MREATAPGAATAGRAGVRGQFCWAIRRPSTRTMRTRIAAHGPSMQLPCRRLRRPRRVLRHGRRPIVRRAMASRLRWLSVEPDNPMPGCLPAPRPSRSPRQRRLRSRTLLRPVVPREPSDGLAKPPRCRVRMLPRCPSGQHASRDPPPPPGLWAAWRIRAKCRCISPATPQCASIPEAAPGRRHPAMDAPPNAGFPPAVRSPGLPESPPAMLHKGSSKMAPE